MNIRLSVKAVKRVITVTTLNNLWIAWQVLSALRVIIVLGKPDLQRSINVLLVLGATRPCWREKNNARHALLGKMAYLLYFVQLVWKTCYSFGENAEKKKVTSGCNKFINCFGIHMKNLEFMGSVIIF